MTYAALRNRAARKGVQLERSGSWVKVVDARNRVVIAQVGGDEMTREQMLLALEDKVSWIDDL